MSTAIRTQLSGARLYPVAPRFGSTICPETILAQPVTTDRADRGMAEQPTATFTKPYGWLSVNLPTEVAT